MVRRRNISIAVDKAEEARQDKRRLEALAFACLIMINFGNNHCKARKFIELKRFFRLGQEKLNRVIKNAVEFGYIVPDGNGGYYAPSLRGNGNRYLSIRFNAVKDAKNRNTSNHTIKSVSDKILEVLLRNRFVQQEELSHVKSLCCSRNEPDAYVDLKKYKVAKKMGQRIVDDKGVSLYEMTSKENMDNVLYRNEGMSKKAIAKFLGCSVSKTHRLVKSVCKKKQVERHKTFEVVKSNKDKNKQEYFGYINPEYVDKDKLGGFLRLITYKGETKMVIQKSNRYTVEKTNFIRYAK